LHLQIKYKDGSMILDIAEKCTLRFHQPG